MAAAALTRTSFVVVAVFLVFNCFHSEALVLEEEFTGSIVTDMKVNLPADEVWAVFRSSDYAKILLKLSPGYFKTIDYVTGNGRAGTVLNITLQPAVGGSNWLDLIVEINDKTKTRLLRHLKGGIMNAGYTRFETGYTVIREAADSCTIRVTTSFELQQESLSNATLVRPNWLTQSTIADYVNSLKSKPLTLNKEYNGEVVADMKVNLPAKDIWHVYSSKDFGHLLLKLSPGVFKQIDYLKGDGGLGTVLNITLQAGDGSQSWLEKIIVLNKKTMTRLVRQIQGGILNAGYTQLETGYRVVREPRRSCTIRAFTPFKLTAQAASVIPSPLQPSWATAITIANYVNSL